jgi:hypothetical protein
MVYLTHIVVHIPYISSEFAELVSCLLTPTMRLFPFFFKNLSVTHSMFPLLHLGSIEWNLSHFMAFLMGLLVLTNALIWFKLSQRSRGKEKTQERQTDHSEEVQGYQEIVIWELIERILSQSNRRLSTEELNSLLGIEPNVSRDSQRSRRAKLIRQMNSAFESKYRTNFINRERDMHDRRHLHYKISDIPVS